RRLDAANDEALAMLSRAYWDKGAWRQAVDAADEALKIRPSNAQAHLWKADALRQIAAIEKDPARQRTTYGLAREQYREFIELTSIWTPAVEFFAFHFIGFGLGSKRHADRQGAYDSLRGSGYLGLCLSEHKIGNSLRAREYCQRALQHTPRDPIAYFILGN